MSQPQANSRHCFVCGVENPAGLKLRFFETGPFEVQAEYTVQEQHQGYPGLVHGGITAAMLDEAAGRSLMVGDSPRFMYTARLDIRYRKNIPLGEPLRLVGRAGKVKDRTATASAAIYDSAGTLLAEAEALLVDVPQQVLGSVDLETLGWKVYPEEEFRR